MIAQGLFSTTQAAYTLANQVPHSKVETAEFKDSVTMANSLASLGSEFKPFGYNWPKVKLLLPDWATEAYAHPVGQLEVKGYAAKHLGLRLGRGGRLERAALPIAKFKIAAGTAQSEVEPARAMATACARLLSRNTATAKSPLPGAAEIRSEALRRSEADWITFAGLVDYAWSMGIPILYLPSLPVIGKKMAGMVTFVHGRPVIVLARKASHSDWLIFILAHELGHIFHGHLPTSEGEAIVDDVFDDDGSDRQETQANDFAANVLSSGGAKLQIPHLMKAPELARAALAYAYANNISPGHVILNAISNSKLGTDGKPPFALAQAALKLVPGADQSQVCKIASRKYLLLDEMKDDDLAFLEKLAVV